jgi:hypothetical protein
MRPGLHAAALAASLGDNSRAPKLAFLATKSREEPLHRSFETRACVRRGQPGFNRRLLAYRDNRRAGDEVLLAQVDLLGFFRLGARFSRKHCPDEQLVRHGLQSEGGSKIREVRKLRMFQPISKYLSPRIVVGTRYTAKQVSVIPHGIAGPGRLRCRRGRRETQQDYCIRIDVERDPVASDRVARKSWVNNRN